MEGSSPSFFRPNALRHYVQRREKAVLPRLVVPRTFLYLWAVLGLLAAGAFTVWAVQVPQYVSGRAVVLPGPLETPERPGHDLLVVAFFPPEHQPHLKPGQTVFLRLGTADGPLEALVIAVEPEVISPDAARRRFGLMGGAAQAVYQPAAATTAQLGTVPGGLPASAYAGSIYPAEIQVGSRSAISFLPLVGRLAGE